MRNLGKLAGAKHPRARRDADLAQELLEHQADLAEAEAVATRQLRARRTRRIGTALCASIILVAGGCILCSSAAGGAHASLTRTQEVPPTVSDLLDAAMSERADSPRLRRLAEVCLAVPASSQDREWIGAALAVVASSRVQGAAAWMEPLLGCPDRDVAYDAATWIKIVRPDWREDAQLRSRIESAISNHEPTGGL